MIFLDEEQVQAFLHWDELFPVMKKALVDFSAGRVIQPVRIVILVPEQAAFFDLMPAVYGDVMGIKLVSVFPHNSRRGLHTHMATIQLLRADTGEPLASNGRTCDYSLADSGRFGPRHARTGLGRRARTRDSWKRSAGANASRGVEAGVKFEEIRIWSRTPEHAERFAAQTGAIATSAERAVRGADVIVAVTNASEPVLKGAWLKAGAHVNAVGAVGLKARELDDEAMESGGCG
jgi:ornithine cyclodeaminase/alanine dehydrogenase-like protein (mu-crystallin family)